MWSQYRSWSSKQIRLCQLLVILGVGALCLLAPRALWAQQSATDEAMTKPCSSCHSDEADAWQISPHAAVSADAATAGAACTDCHGAYERGHPDAARMDLKVDSSMCVNCHKDTFDQWQHSVHGQNSVQCISCHLPHSQEMRLTDERLCTSCHKESLDDALHTAHWDNAATCTSCHMTAGPETGALASSDPSLAAVMTPRHDFVTVSARNCLECHREDVYADPQASDGNVTVSEKVLETAKTAPLLVNQLEAAERTNRSLLTLSVANLGLGVGVGGVFGVIFMLVFMRFGWRR